MSGHSLSYKKLLNALECGVMILDLELNILFWNDWLTAYTDVSISKALKSQLNQLFPEVRPEGLKRQMRATLALQAPMFYGSLPDNQLLEVPLNRIMNPIFKSMQQSITLAPYDVKNGLVALILNDQTSLKEAQHRLEAKVEEVKKMQSGYLDIIDQQILLIKCDYRGRINKVSSAFLQVSKYTKDELVGISLEEFIKLGQLDEVNTEEIWEQVNSGVAWNGELAKTRKDGSKIWLSAVVTPSLLSSGKINEINVILADISDKKKIELISTTDPLTGIANRKKFAEALEREIQVATRYGTGFSVAICDLDHFKKINDTFGHQVGDQVLVGTCRIFEREIRETDYLARWGGEEFVLLFPHVDLRTTQGILEKIRNALALHPFEQAGQVTASFGATAFKLGDKDHSLLERADRALYKSKNDGRNRVTIF